MEILDQHFRLSISKHPNLRHVDFRSLVWSEQDVVVGCIFGVLKLGRSEMSAEMIATPRCHMQSSQHFFILNVPPGDWEKLSAKSQFAQLAGSRIGLKLLLMLVDRSLT